MAWKAMMNIGDSHDTNRLRFLHKKINNDDDAAAQQRMKDLQQEALKSDLAVQKFRADNGLIIDEKNLDLVLGQSGRRIPVDTLCFLFCHKCPLLGKSPVQWRAHKCRNAFLQHPHHSTKTTRCNKTDHTIGKVTPSRNSIFAI